MTRPIRVLLADDHPLVRAGLRATLATAPDLALVAEAATADEAQRLCHEHGPDVLLLDLAMPGPPPAATVAYVGEQCPRTRVIVLTAHDEEAYARGLIAMGVAGYVLKDEAPEALVQAIRSVAQGGSWFSYAVIRKLAEPERPAPAAGALTGRERQLLGLLAQGWDNARIAGELHLSEQTVRNYLSRLYAKLGVRSRPEAMAWLRDHGAG